MGAPTAFLTSQFVRLSLPAFLLITAAILAPVEADDDDLKLPHLNLSEWKRNGSYDSSTYYDARGMAPLYNLTHQIIRLFVDDQPIPEDYIVLNGLKLEAGPKVIDQNWGDLLKAYWALLLVIVLTALLVVLMPIIGLCFCCCRCAGACGGRSQPFDKKHDTCRRVVLGLLLICLTTGILFGVVVAFVTNSYMQEGLEESTTAARAASNDLNVFLDTTSKEVDHLLVQNYKELTVYLEYLVRDATEQVVTELEKHFSADSLKFLYEFADKLPKIRDSLVRMKGITNELRVNASQLSDGLRGVKRELLVKLTNCGEDVCRDILKKYKIGTLDANGIDYNQLPEVNDIIEDVQALLANGVVSDISDGKKQIDGMRKNINNTIEESIPAMLRAMKKAGDTSKEASDTIQKACKDVAKVVADNTDKGTKHADEYIEKYSIYRFHVGVAISSILLLVLVCLVISLFCGICGKRPEGYGDDCCNKGAGARFLMLAIAIIFLTISILAVAALVHFLAGIVLHRGVCIPLRDPENDQIFGLLDNAIDLSKITFSENFKPREISGNMPPLRISHVIAACKKNQSIYEVLRLQNYIDIREIQDKLGESGINKTLNKLVDNIHDLSNIQISNKGMEDQIKDLADSKLQNFDAGKFVDHLEGDITSESLDNISRALFDAASKLQRDTDIRNSLQIQAMHLEAYEAKLVKPMRLQIDTLKNLAIYLEKDLKYEDNDFQTSMMKLLGEIKRAQSYIKHNRTQFLTEQATILINHFTTGILNYSTFVVESVQERVGECSPIANVYDSLIVAVCNRFVDPFNGFWVGVAWCVILFLPTLIISAKLSTLYQKSDPYPGPLVESEYLYDAYSERDNIPLANGPKNKRRKAKDRRRGSRDRRGDYYEDSGSSHGAPVGRDTRYSDMAPRHWDGGPPRYQNPPMAPPASEYERPPPYYYPGAPSEQE